MRIAKRSAGLASAIALTASTAVLAAAASQNALPVLGRLDAGLWELRDLDGGGSLSPVCLGNRDALVQLQHRRAVCALSVVAQTRDQLEVRYNCPAGFGQTLIRVEGPRLARIESQGIDNGVPFGFRAEARRVGECPT